VTAWVIRSGALGERDQWALNGAVAGGGFERFPDLSQIRTSDEMRALTEKLLEGSSRAKIRNVSSQLWALRSGVKPGDLVVLPLKSTAKVALGICTGGYTYHPMEPADRRHTILVDWRRIDVPRSVMHADLLKTLNSATTIFSARRNNAESRLRAVLSDGVDPGT
jgi:restriction system protein